MTAVEHGSVASGGDFITNSSSFVEIPGLGLIFNMEEPSNVFVVGYLWVYGKETEVGLLIDGSVSSTVMMVHPPPEEAVQAAFHMMAHLAPGPHSIQMALRTMNGGADCFPEGPREWSPRKKKKGPFHPAKAILSTDMPGIIKVLVA